MFGRYIGDGHSCHTVNLHYYSFVVVDALDDSLHSCEVSLCDLYALSRLCQVTAIVQEDHTLVFCLSGIRMISRRLEPASVGLII